MFMLMLRNWERSEFSKTDGDQKDRGLWDENDQFKYSNSVDTKKKRTTWIKSNA